jgi:hypothetical protein
MATANVSTKMEAEDMDAMHIKFLELGMLPIALLSVIMNTLLVVVIVKARYSPYYCCRTQSSFSTLRGRFNLLVAAIAFADILHSFYFFHSRVASLIRRQSEKITTRSCFYMIFYACVAEEVSSCLNLVLGIDHLLLIIATQRLAKKIEKRY